MERRPLLDVSGGLGVSPSHIARVLLGALEFAEGVRARGVTGTAARMAAAMEAQTRDYLQSQESALITWTASPFAEFGSGYANYGAN
jgi:hypothetical protein